MSTTAPVVRYGSAAEVPARPIPQATKRHRVLRAFIDHTVRYLLGNRYSVILEGILASHRYGPMLTKLIADHDGRPDRCRPRRRPRAGGNGGWPIGAGPGGSSTGAGGGSAVTRPPPSGRGSRVGAGGTVSTAGASAGAGVPPRGPGSVPVVGGSGEEAAGGDEVAGSPTPPPLGRAGGAVGSPPLPCWASSSVVTPRGSAGIGASLRHLVGDLNCR